MTHTQTNALSNIEAEPTPDRPMRPFFILWTGQSLSLVGSQAVQFALIWWLTETSGSATILATATLLGLLPPIVLGPVIGALIDRWNRKTVMLAADGFVAVASLLLAWLFSAGIADIPHVLALLFLRALGAAFHSPAMTASTTLMVPEKHLTRIQGLNQSMQGLLTIVAAPLGALLLAIFSMTGVMMVDVGTALLAILPLLAIRVPRPTRSDDLGRSSVWAETAAGFRYLVRRRGHATLIAMAALINALLVPAFSLLPLLVLQRLNGGAAQLGWLSSSLGVGLIVGGVALGAWGGFRKRIVHYLDGDGRARRGGDRGGPHSGVLVSVGARLHGVRGADRAARQRTRVRHPPGHRSAGLSGARLLARRKPRGRGCAAGSDRGRPGGRDRGRRRLVPGGRNCLRGDGNRGLLRARPDGNRGRYRRRGRSNARRRAVRALNGGRSDHRGSGRGRTGLVADSLHPSGGLRS